ncbi:hypothetical protein [Natrinema sp. SYSU A 869]|uniref:hypothetical protein n=1 Tax=Natrinema sp. SYSU A 869 TaxID=2871694 RepID=UPI001CA449B9|nr:hypothetical protein [Natrinema sp. SYSU A 869]
MVVTNIALTAPIRTVAVTPASAFDTLVGSPLSQAASVTLVWTAITLLVAPVLLAGLPQSMRGLRDDLITEPDTTFAVGFVALFGLLICSVLPLFVGTSLEHSALITLGLIVATPGLIACIALLIVGGCVGTVAVGDRLGDRLGSGSPSSRRSLALGLLALGGSQLVPIVGTIATIAVASVGSGAIVNRGNEAWRGEPLLAASSDVSVDQGTADRSTAPLGRDRPERHISSGPRDDGETGPIPTVPGTRVGGEDKEGADRLEDATWRLEGDYLDLETDEQSSDERVQSADEASQEDRKSDRRDEMN